MDWHREGKATFRIGPAFYRPKSALTRDLGVLAAAAWRQQQGHLTILDAMTGCGVRSLRYGLEARADFLWVNDGNRDLRPLIQENLTANLPLNRYQLSSLSVQRLFAKLIDQGDRMDWLDLDCFGSPAASLPMAIACTQIGGCLYLTATDGKSLSGQQSGHALRQFGAYTRHHPSVHEQAVRVLTGLAIQTARQQGLDVRPLFSLFCGQTYRVLLRLLHKAPAGDQNYGFLGYCHHCGQTHAIPWQKLHMTECPLHDYRRPLAISGPMWLGPLHDPTFLEQMRTLAQAWGWQRRQELLTLMQAEAFFPPYYIPLSEVGRRGKIDIPARDRLIQELQIRGHQACRSSMMAQALKTTASLIDIIEMSREMH